MRPEEELRGSLTASTESGDELIESGRIFLSLLKKVKPNENLLVNLLVQTFFKSLESCPEHKHEWKRKNQRKTSKTK